MKPMHKTMTADELNSLIDVSPRQEYVDVICQDKWVRIPTINNVMSLEFEPDERPKFVDGSGVTWETGFIGGISVRRKMANQFSASTNP
jgi:hypothetical protein